MGVMLRLVLGVHGVMLLLALYAAPAPAGLFAVMFDWAALLEPALLFSLSLLALFSPWLSRLPGRIGQVVVIDVVIGVTWAVFVLGEGDLLLAAGARNVAWRPVLLSALIAAGGLWYFELRMKARAPAGTEARIVALNARIRPHFLFNSLNAVLSLIRARPREAESALESLADLFRAAMRDPSNDVRLVEELELGRQYLALEALRLGERLAVDWQVQPGLDDLLMPPLMLQPLLENAVYHGIEPAPEGGVIEVRIARKGDFLMMEIANPITPQGQLFAVHEEGNHMALANIRERLKLYYDLEAQLDVQASSTRYLVKIMLPCHWAKKAAV